MKFIVEWLHSGVYIALQALRVISYYMIALSVMFFLREAALVAIVYLFLTNIILDLVYDC